METQKVYAAIAAVMHDVSKEGISKDRRNQAQGYNFRGIDEVYNALSPILAKHKLCILPRVLSRDLVERQTQKGGTLFYVTVEAEFDFISAEDGSKHTIKTYGEAMDSGDKATNKAMSAAYKYAAMQAFCIPTEGDNDADAQTHDVAGKKPAPAPRKPAEPADNPFDGDPVADALIAALKVAKSMDDLNAWGQSDAVQVQIGDLSKGEAARVRAAWKLQKDKLLQTEAVAA